MKPKQKKTHFGFSFLYLHCVLCSAVAVPYLPSASLKKTQHLILIISNSSVCFLMCFVWLVGFLITQNLLQYKQKHTRFLKNSPTQKTYICASNTNINAKSMSTKHLLPYRYENYKVLERPSSQMSYLDHFLKEQAVDHGVMSGNDVDNMNNGVSNQSVSNQVSLFKFFSFLHFSLRE